MKRASLFVMAALLVSVFAVARVGAQTDQMSGSTSMGAASDMTGTVVSSSSTTVVVRTDSGDQMTFMVDGASTVPSTLTAGDRVTVSYHPMDNGQYHVATVTAVPKTRTTSGYGTTGTSDTNYGTSDALPRTAGGLPLVALIGTISVGAAIGMRLINRARMRA